MKALVFILNKVTALNDILSKLSTNGIGGGTILNSTGMAHTLMDFEEEDINFGHLRNILHPERKESKTMIFVNTDEFIAKIKELLTSIVDLNEPDVGFIFTFNVEDVISSHKEQYI